MALPDGDETRTILKGLIADWHAGWADGVRMRVRDSEDVGVVVFALTSHVFILADAALRLYEADLAPVAVPLVRQALECAYTAVWVERSGAEAARALMHERTRNQRNTLKEFVDAGFDENAAATAAVEASMDSLAVSASESGRRFKERCSELVIGRGIYALYRSASATSHAGTSIVNLYLHRVDVTESNPVGLAFSDEPRSGDSEMWLSCLLAMVVRAGLAWSRLDATHRQRTRLKALGKRLDVTAEPQQTPVGFKRTTQRDRAARRRRRDETRRRSDERPSE
jgi:hypothetical protein